MDNTPVSVSSEDEDEANLPSREECERRCQAFATVTGTDSALAMFYLQDRDWDLDRAVSAFFEDRDGTQSEHHRQPADSVDGAVPLPPPCRAPTTAPAVSAQPDSLPPTPSPSEMNARAAALDPEPHRIRLMSWNIDGLDQNNVANRAKGVCDVIKKERPQVVFLQEVVSASLAVLEHRLPDYQVVVGGETGYFTAVLLRTGEVELEDSTVADFLASRMGRNLLTVQCRIKRVPFVLATSHLESQAEYSDERLRQLRIALEKVRTAPLDRTVVFGGDLNLRDKEAVQAPIPENVYDLWEVTGKRPEAKFTWDMRLNDNKEFDRFKPRCRFDRLYLRHCGTRQALKPVYFELVGLQRLASCRRYPSDHWGLLAHFDLLPNEQTGSQRQTDSQRQTGAAESSSKPR